MRQDIDREEVKRMLYKGDPSAQLNEFFVMSQHYTAAIKEIRTKLEILNDEFAVKHDHNPIHNIESRLKRKIVMHVEMMLLIMSLLRILY